MLERIRKLNYLVLVILFSVGFGNRAIAQGKIYISTGIGLPELLNVGLGVRHNQMRFGITIGGIPPLEDENTLSISSNMSYHFGKHSKFSDLRPWYGRIGLDYVRDETEYSIYKYLYINSRLGRDFNISGKFGITIDAGLLYELLNEEIEKKPIPRGSWSFNFDFPLLPSFGVWLFYRI